MADEKPTGNLINAIEDEKTNLRRIEDLYSRIRAKGKDLFVIGGWNTYLAALSTDKGKRSMNSDSMAEEEWREFCSFIKTRNT